MRKLLAPIVVVFLLVALLLPAMPVFAGDPLAVPDNEQPKDPQVLKALAKAGIDKNYVGLKKGYGKRTAVEDYRKTARAGKGVINLKVTAKTGDVVKTLSVNPEESIIITTAKGIVIRTSLKNIRVMGRATQGVRIVKLQPEDYVTDLVKVPDNDLNGNGEEK